MLTNSKLLSNRQWLIDAGATITGIHCAADGGLVSPMPTNDDNWRHWKGSAPDIGTVEYSNNNE